MAKILDIIDGKEMFFFGKIDYRQWYEWWFLMIWEIKKYFNKIN